MSPVKMSLEANKEYHFCTCGKSATSVLCDGSHRGSGFTPKAFTVTEAKEYYLCACKKSANAPFCDGSHAK